jgi:hypothetical protein
MTKPKITVNSKVPGFFTVILGLIALLAGATAISLAAKLSASTESGNSGLAFVTGLFFFLVGIAMLAFPLSRKAAAYGAFAAMLVFVVAFNWVAFVPGGRNFTHQTSMGGTGSYSKSSEVSEAEGRTVFGVAAAALDTFIFSGFYYTVKHRKSSRKVSKINRQSL